MANTHRRRTRHTGYLPEIVAMLASEAWTEEQRQQVHREMEMTQGVIAHTLKSFKLDVQVGALTRGPRFTRYEFTVPQGKSVKSVAYRSSDIMAATHSYSIRIHTPIPGKPTVGIELENPVQEPVLLRGLALGQDFARQQLPLALGQDVCGEPVVAELAELPHLLLSGAPGSGVPEGLHALLLGLLCKRQPQEMGSSSSTPPPCCSSPSRACRTCSHRLSQISTTRPRPCAGAYTRPSAATPC